MKNLSQALKKVAGRYLLQSLSSSIGLTAKFQQHLSMRLGLNEVPHDNILSREEALNLIQSESPEFYHKIHFFSEHSFPASLGQVFEAKTAQQRFAIKIQYPNLTDHLEDQVEKMVELFVKYSPARSVPFDSELLRKDLISEFEEECDYLHEAALQTRFRQLFESENRNHQHFLIPQVYLEWSTKKILVQDFCRGLHLKDLLTLPVEVRTNVALKLVDFTLACLLERRILHGDFQPGNWAYNPQADQLIIYDFGCTLELTDPVWNALLSLYKKSFSSTPIDVFQDFESLGFVGEKLTPIRAQLFELNRLLFQRACLRRKQEFQIDKENLADSIETLLGAQKWVFRTAGPTWFLFFMRTWQSLLFAIEQLAPRAEDFGARSGRTGSYIDFKIQSRLGLLDIEPQFGKFPIEMESHDPPQNSTLILKIQVFKTLSESNSSVEQVLGEFEFPHQALENIESYIPTESLRAIESRVSLAEIKRKAHDTAYTPQVLFDIQAQGRRYLVQLQKRV